MRRRAGDARHHRHHVGPGGTQLYTVSDQKDSIAVLTRNATTGELTPGAGDAQCVAPGGNGAWPNDDNPLLNEKIFDCKTANPHSEYLNGISFSPDGAHAYVAGRPGMAAYTRNAADRRADDDRRQGRAAPPTTRRRDACLYNPNAKYARRVWVRPDGKRAYAAIGESAGVMTWDRDPATGGLTPLKREAGCTAMRSFGVRYFHACAPARHLAGAWFAIGSPDGRHLYAGSLYDREIITFAIVRTTFSPDPVDFFVQEVGQTAAAKTVTVRNDGTDPMPIAGVRSAARTRRATPSRRTRAPGRSPSARPARSASPSRRRRRPTSTRRSTSPPRAARRARTRRR